MHVPASLSATFHLYFRPESFPVPEAIITIVCLYKATGVGMWELQGSSMLGYYGKGKTDHLMLKYNDCRTNRHHYLRCR